MRVATFNLHAGVDGWGRATRVVECAASLNADVLILPELWRGVDGQDLYQQLGDRLVMRGTFVPLANAERVTSGTGGRSWQPLLAHFTGEHGLYFSDHRSLRKAQLRRRSRKQTERGEWGLGILTRLPIEELRVERLDRLPREKVCRALIIARLSLEGRAFYLVAVHGAHLSHGSFRQYRRVRSLVDALEQGVPVVLGGDFNSWRPVLRFLLPGWQSLVKSKTWPARLPHSQIDHLFARGPWRSLGGTSVDGGSDHRALYADVELN